MMRGRQPTGRRPAPGVRALVTAMVLAASLTAAGLAPSLPGAARAADGVEVTGATTLTVQPARQRVRVVADLRIENHKPSTTSGNVITSWIVRKWSIAVPDEARNVRATRDGRRLPTTVRERDGYDQVVFDLRPGVRYRQAADVRISYDLPDGGARSASRIRVGRAYLSFYAFAHGDDRSTVRIVVPAGYEVETRGGPIELATTDAGATVLTTAGSVDDASWYVVVTGDRPDALRETTFSIDLDGQPRFLEIRSWPEDATWGERVRSRLTRGLIALEALHGLDWPVVGPLRVTESATDSLEGYAAFYDPGESGVLDEITIGEDPDEAVIVHEAAHAWFNDGLLTGRWINEGLADAYAARAMEALGSQPPAPTPVSRDTPIAFALNLWGPPARIEDERGHAREAYAYDASRHVLDTLIDEIGVSRMAAILEAAAKQEIAFIGEPRTETHTLLADFRDWRYLLDLLQQRGGSEQASELFETWVVADVERPLLADHEAAVARYDRLIDAAGGWRPAHAVRSQLARWAFEEVDRELDLAEAALARRAEIVPQAARLGLDDGGALRSAWEGAVVSYDRVVSLAEAQLETLDAFEAARAVVAAERSTLVAIGLLGSEPESSLVAAADAYRTGDLSETRGLAAAAVALVDGADEVGGQRAAVSGGVGLLLVVGLSGGLVLVRRRRRRSDVAPAIATSLSAMAAPGPAEPAEAPATLAAATGPGAGPEADRADAVEDGTEP